MNKEINVKVKTPLGLTETRPAGSGPSQGSVDAPIISANSIGNSVEDTLDDEEKEIKYGNDILISALTYMDDIGSLAESKEDSQ